MRRALLAVAWTVLLLLATQPLTYAGSDTALGVKNVVAVLPVLNNTGLKADHYTSEMVEERMADKFGNGKYTILSGQVLLDGLKREGIDDPGAVDNATLLTALKRMHVDYCVLSELLVVVTDQKMVFPTALLFIKSWTATVPLYVNIIDVNQGTSFYESTIVENGRSEAIIGFSYQSSAVKIALNKALDRFDREITIPE